MRKFGPFDTSVFYEVENRRMQRAFNPQTGFVKTGQGAVTAGTGAELVIAAYPDGALVDGLYVENPTTEAVTLTTNTASTNPRIDRLVMRLDMSAKTIAPFQIVGTPAASPSAPALTSTATVVDMPLCQYRFPGSGSAQNPSSLVDERVYSTNNAGTSGVLAGTAPPAGTPLLTKTWVGSLTTNVSGDATVTFPGGAFPNGLVSVLPVTAGYGGSPAAAPAGAFWWVPWGPSLTSVNLRLFSATSSPAASGTMAAVVTAIGW